MFSIKLKIIFSYTLLFGILITIFAFIIYQTIKQNNLSRLDANLNSYSNIMQTEIEEELNENNKIIESEIKTIPAQGLYGVRIQIFDKQKGVVLADSILSKENSISEYSYTTKANTFKILNINGQRFRALFSPIEADEDTNFIIQTAASLRNIDEDLDRLLLIFWFVIPFTLIITGLTAYFISKKAFKPVTQMAEMANQISIDNLDRRLELPGSNDEIYLLGEKLNLMIERIDNSVKAQKQFIADASHEIKTPLTIIQTELELTEKKLNDFSSKQNIKTALSEVERLNALVQSLLTIVKLESFNNSINFKMFRLDELLVNCIQLMRKTADEKNIQLAITLAEPVNINADEEKLKSIFINLLDNAIKYSPQAGSVAIDLQADNFQAIISIADNGIGISKEEIDKIFKRFYRSAEIRSEINGSGLGLSIAQKLTEMHNGKLTVQSEVGKGSKFLLSLPLNIPIH